VDGHSAFAVDYVNVGYYGSRADKLNSFQVVLIERGETGAGNFDIEFNYDSMQWEAGTASGGVNGLGGDSARVGVSKGTGQTGTAFELTGSAVDGAFLNGGPNALATHSFNSSEPGRYVFPVRNAGSSDGLSEDSPFLPDGNLPPDANGQPGGWLFNNFPPRRWFDPPTAYGFEYTMTTPGALFTAIEFPSGFGPFTVSLDGGATVLGTNYTPCGFTPCLTFPGSGVSSFRVTGINPLVDPAVSNAFPLWIDFNQSLASFSMTPLNIEPSNTVPEPGTWMLLSLGGGLIAIRKIRSRRA
jgi:hypothetical protein